LHLDYLAPSRNIIPALRLARLFSHRGVVMGFIKFTKGTSLSDKDRKSLQKLLTDERKKLQAALKDVDASLSMLGGKKKAKKGKKGKKGK
jgi:hypothetical protein